MADPLNLYLDKAGYTAAAHSDKTSEVSRISSLNKVAYDGLNIHTDKCPNVGDVIYLDQEGNRHFYSNESFNPAKIPNNYVPVGVITVAKGTSPNRRLTIFYYNPPSMQFQKAWIDSIAPINSNPISFNVYAPDWSTRITLSDTFSYTSNYSANPDAWTAELDTWLRAHQPHEENRGGGQHDWHAARLTFGSATKTCIIADYMNNYTYQINTPSATSLSWEPIIPELGIPKPSRDFYIESGEIYNRVAITPEAVTKILRNATSFAPPSPFLNEADYQASAKMTAKYPTYYDYIYSRRLDWPTKKDMHILDSYNNAKTYTHRLAEVMHPDISNTMQRTFPAAYRACHPTGSSLVDDSFEWYMASLPDLVEFSNPFALCKLDDGPSLIKTIRAMGCTISSLNGVWTMTTGQYRLTNWATYGFANQYGYACLANNGSYYGNNRYHQYYYVPIICKITV